jgi:O-antigen/teichoic acid export membrane protein
VNATAPVEGRAVGFAGPAALFMSARVVNMAVGLVMIPVLIHSLGGRGFAVWAILLSCSVVFNELQFGMHTALVRALAVADRTDSEGIARLSSSAVGFLLAVHLAALPFIAVTANSLAEWLRLPNVGRWHAGVAVLGVFISVSLRAVLLTGTYAFFATALFHRAATLSLAQAFVSNTTATLVAWWTKDLAATLASFWMAQLVVVGAGFGLARTIGWRPKPALISPRVIRQLLAYGVRVQLSEWAQIINFQFDKFVIVRVLGLWPAALYEVSNRSVLALRSIPASGMETFLPVAIQRTANSGDRASAARVMARLAVYASLVFFAAPLAVGPVFLYAWVGEMGYVSRHVFLFLVIGAMANLLALPLATVAQAAGRPEVQARAAMASILLNVPLSLILVRVSGLEGAALGSSLAMVLGMAVLVWQARRALGRDVVSAVTETVVRHAPLALACGVWGIVVHIGFTRWFEATKVAMHYTRGQRAGAAMVTLALYAACLVSLLVLKLVLHGLDTDERQWLARLGSISGIRPPRAAPAFGSAGTGREANAGVPPSPPPDA